MVAKKAWEIITVKTKKVESVRITTSTHVRVTLIDQKDVCGEKKAEEENERLGITKKTKEVDFNPKNPEHLQLFLREFHPSCISSTSSNIEVSLKDNTERIFQFMGHENVHQVRYNFVKFIENGHEYNVLSSFPIYICNDEGKTVESLKC